jgi:hypothetical protein
LGRFFARYDSPALELLFGRPQNLIHRNLVQTNITDRAGFLKTGAAFRVFIDHFMP